MYRSIAVKIFVILFSLAFFSCDIGTALYSEKELEKMYGTDFYSGNKKLENGSVVSRGIELKAVLTNESDSRLPYSIEINVKDIANNQLAKLVFTLGEEIGSIKVASLTDNLPPFKLPENLPDGYYIINSIAKDKDGTKISSTELAILNYNGLFETAILTAYPGNAKAERTSLFKLESSFPEDTDPWLRWFVNGTEQQSGFVSEKADKLVWKAPKTGGLHTIKVEIYPFKPPLQSAPPPFQKAELKIPVSLIPANDRELDSKTWALFDFDGSLGDSGSRPGKNNYAITGKPYLDTWASGFGYVFGPDSSLSSDSALLPPLYENSMQAFTISISLAKLKTHLAKPALNKKESILIVQGDKGIFRLGIENDMAFMSFADEEPVYTKLATGNYSQISFFLNKDKVYFYINNKPAGEANISKALGTTNFGAWVFAGPNSYEAIYDELYVRLGAWPAFRLAEENRLGSAFINAYGFEGGEIDKNITPSGEVKLLHEKAILEPGASFAIDTQTMTDTGFSIAMDIIKGQVAIELELNNGSKLYIDNNSTIKVDNTLFSGEYSGKAITGNISAGIELGKEGLKVKGFNRQSLNLPKNLTLASGLIRIENSGNENLELSRLLIAKTQN